ncbi:ribosome maturation factor RimP [Micromonospora sp. NPDC047134]|uniref:ribosome maturation factor RimP n=1 Tax=Micromonospora sp. NPDC047134 TaxID=3154340 RepID=UPI0033E74216
MTQRGRATRTTGRPRGGGPAPRGGQGPRGDLAARRERLRAVIAPVVDGAGYDLEDLSVSRAGRRHVVRVIVDADGGINLDAVAEISRAVSAALDAAEETGGDIVAGEYQLEVSSPGVDRPLTLPRHWRRNIGRLVRVTVRGAGESSDRQVTGRVVAADEESVELEVDGEGASWPYADLGPGRVQIEFSRLDELPDSEDVDDDDDDDVEDEER